MITSSGQTLGAASAEMELGSAQSFSKLGPIVSYRWVQIDGTPLKFDSPQSATTKVRWGAVPPTSLEKITVALSVTDVFGNPETERIVVSVLVPWL